MTALGHLRLTSMVASQNFDGLASLVERTMRGSDSHMAHFFLSETFVPYRGLVPGLRP